MSTISGTISLICTCDVWVAGLYEEHNAFQHWTDGKFCIMCTWFSNDTPQNMFDELLSLHQRSEQHADVFDTDLQTKEPTLEPNLASMFDESWSVAFGFLFFRLAGDLLVHGSDPHLFDMRVVVSKLNTSANSISNFVESCLRFIGTCTIDL